MPERDVRERWKRYLHYSEEISTIEGPIESVSENELNTSLKEMKTGRAPRPSGVTRDMLKSGRKARVKELTKVYKKIDDESSQKGSETASPYRLKEKEMLFSLENQKSEV